MSEARIKFRFEDLDDDVASGLVHKLDELMKDGLPAVKATPCGDRGASQGDFVEMMVTVATEAAICTTFMFLEYQFIHHQLKAMVAGALEDSATGEQPVRPFLRAEIEGGTPEMQDTFRKEKTRLDLK